MHLSVNTTKFSAYLGGVIMMLKQKIKFRVFCSPRAKQYTDPDEICHGSVGLVSTAACQTT